jgi:hypothetical protein
VDIWDSAVENREKEADFVERFKQKYKEALEALKSELAEKTLKKQFSKKKAKLTRAK